MEETPVHTRQLRAAIHSLLGSEEPTYMQEDIEKPEILDEEEPVTRGRKRQPD